MFRTQGIFAQNKENESKICSSILDIELNTKIQELKLFYV